MYHSLTQLHYAVVSVPSSQQICCHVHARFQHHRLLNLGMYDLVFIVDLSNQVCFYLIKIHIDASIESNVRIVEWHWELNLSSRL